MNNFKFTIMSILSFIIMVIIQVNILNKITILGIVPDLFIIYCVYNCILSDNNNLSLGIIIVLGLIFDISLGNFIGIHSLIGFIITILTPIFCTRVATDTKIGMMIYVFICTFLSQIIYGAIYLVLNRGVFVLDKFLLIVLISSLYNFILTLFIHLIFSKYIKEKDEMYTIIKRY